MDKHESSKNMIASITLIYLKYVKNLNLDLKLSQDTLLSGWLCTMFMLSLSLKQENSIKEENWIGILKRMCAYVGIYILLDHYIDCSDISRSDKSELIALVREKNAYNQCNPIYNKLLELRRELVSTKEDESYLNELIDVVIKSYRVQTKTNLSFKKYLSICKAKGGTTVVSGVHLIYKDLLVELEDRSLYKLGYCVQLFDDIIDCSSDIKNGINTACTYLVKKRKKLDFMYMLLYKKTMLLSKRFYLQGFAIRIALHYSVDRSKHYSYSFRKSLGLRFHKRRDKEKRFKESVEESLRDIYLSI